MRDFTKEIFHGSWADSDMSHQRAYEKWLKETVYVSHSGQLTHKLRQKLEEGMSLLSGLQQCESYLHLPIDLQERDQKQEVKNILKIRADLEDVVRDMATAMLSVEIDIKYDPEYQAEIDKQRVFVETKDEL